MKNHKRTISGVVRIPVVVHIVYNAPEQNISDESVLSQIRILNEDFRRTNADANDHWISVAADSEIEFYLATSDPSCQPTTGITRTSTSTVEFVSGDDGIKKPELGGVAPWDATKYLNIWVGNLGGGLLGYAQFPGGSVATDGVVIQYQAFGDVGAYLIPQYNKGRTATHEVGHYLDLRHIWGDAPGCDTDDLVDDTPLQDDKTFGCPASKESCGGPNMFENYMDYSDDNCLNVLTQGQKTRMRSAIEVARSTLIQPLCSLPSHCTDGIQNNDETGVDCGGVDCPACPPPSHCTDGIQNNDETGVDCGGVDCLPCPPPPGNCTDGIQNNDETGVDCGGATCPPCTPHCIDGIQNFDETGVDCGGIDCIPCLPPHCSDGIKNNDETGVDCGGIDCLPCPLPPHCSDGIKNFDETGVDCGGADCIPCPPPPPHCDDGIKNYGEFGIDCGGTCPLKCTLYSSPITVTLHLDIFPSETSWEIREIKSNSLFYSAKASELTTTDVLLSPPLFFNPGTYKFTLFDSFGDGFCCNFGEGSYRVADAFNRTIAKGTGEIGFEKEHLFKIGFGQPNNFGFGFGNSNNWNEGGFPFGKSNNNNQNYQEHPKSKNK